MTRINPLIDGANEDMCNPYNVTNPAQGQACWTAAEWEDDPDPGHSVTQTTEQIYGSQDDTAALPPMIGFVQQYEKVDPGNVRGFFFFIYIFYLFVLIPGPIRAPTSWRPLSPKTCLPRPPLWRTLPCLTVGFRLFPGNLMKIKKKNINY